MATLDASDNPGPERYLGDSIGASLTGGEGDRLTVFAGDGADSSQKLVDKLLDVSRSMSLTLHDLSLENLRLFLMGTVESVTPAAVSDEMFPACEPGDEFQLGTYKGASGAKGGGLVIPAAPASGTKITGKAGSSDTAFAETKIRWVPKQADGRKGGTGDDAPKDGAGGSNPANPLLIVYGDTGRIEIPPAGETAAGDGSVFSSLQTGFKLSYTPDTTKREFVASATEPVEGAVRYVEYDPREGVGRNVYMAKATIRPNGEWALKARDTEQQLGLTCESLGKVYISAGVTA
ncbi:MAG: hypothetical protein OXG72_21625 [Acidobacteria bacterium]|nr:hypothetical protein [Acidobacteriota bacterium]